MSSIDFHLPFESSSASVSFDVVTFIININQNRRYLMLIGYSKNLNDISEKLQFTQNNLTVNKVDLEKP